MAYSRGLANGYYPDGKRRNVTDRLIEQRLDLLRQGTVTRAGAVPAAVATGAAPNRNKGPDTAIIKRALAWRAVYRKGQGPGLYIRTFSDDMVVPHPKNRGGDPIVSLRARQLGNTLAKDGYDKLEASSSAVAVQETPDSKGGRGQWISFQNHYEKSIVKDEYMVKMIDAVPATIGSLSHGHHNCLGRNIYAGMLGCVCGHYSGSSRGHGVDASKRGAGGCTCEANKPFGV